MLPTIYNCLGNSTGLLSAPIIVLPSISVSISFFAVSFALAAPFSGLKGSLEAIKSSIPFNGLIGFLMSGLL